MDSMMPHQIYRHTLHDQQLKVMHATQGLTTIYLVHHAITCYVSHIHGVTQEQEICEILVGNFLQHSPWESLNSCFSKSCSSAPFKPFFLKFNIHAPCIISN